MKARIFRHSKRGVAHYTVETLRWFRWKEDKVGTFDECLEYINERGALEGASKYVVAKLVIPK